MTHTEKLKKSITDALLLREYQRNPGIDHNMGGCPECGSTGNLFEVRMHGMFFCEEHKIAWPAVDYNLRYHEPDMTQDEYKERLKEQEEYYEKMGFGEYKHIELSEATSPFVEVSGETMSEFLEIIETVREAA